MTSTKKIEFGRQFWCNAEGKYHRLDGPAVIYPDGSEEWYVEGKRHRLDKPAVIWANGYQAWYVDGLRHRIDSPAIIRPNGYQAWYVDGLRHRIDGPAIIRPDGTEEWYIRGNDITEKVNPWFEQNNRSYPFDLNTQILFKLTFGV